MASVLGRICPCLCRSSDPPSPSGPPPLLLQMFLSSRFIMIDAYVRPPENCGKLQRSCRYEMQYRKMARKEIPWTSCQNEELMRLQNGPGRLCTIYGLDPMTEYEVRAKVVSEIDGLVVAETLPRRTITTSTIMTLIRSYKATEEVDQGSGQYRITAAIGDILEEDLNANPVNLPQVSDDDREYANGLAGFAYLRNVRTNQSGYVALTSLARNPAGDVPSLMQDEESFFNVNRRVAEVWMMRPNVEPGRFLLRPSHSPEFMALSVRFGNSEDSLPQVEHFSVHIMPDGYGCYVNLPHRTFEDIKSLLVYYQKHQMSSKRQAVLLSGPFPRNPHAPTNLQEIAIPRAQITCLERLGSGNFGEVYRGKLNNLDVAIKKLLPTRREPGAAPQNALLISLNRDALLREAREMAPYFHDNLVRLIGVCVDEQPYLIISELMNRGSLLQWLNDDTVAADIYLQLVVFILSQVACGMAYLEQKNVVHRDLRAANVLVHDENDRLEIKIADFGLTRRIRENEEIYTAQPGDSLPVRWTSPEAYARSEFSVKSDVWSFGVLAYEVFTLGALPYKGKTNTEVCVFLLSGGRITIEECRSNRRRVALPRRFQEGVELCPDSLFLEISHCWKEDPHERPTFAALYDFLDNYEIASNYRGATNTDLGL